MSKPTADDLIKHFEMQMLPAEGGMFVETYRSEQAFSADKPAGTAILYLLTSDDNSFSAMHKLPTDEVYHFYLGDPVDMLLLHPDGRAEQVTLGRDVLSGERIQFVVPAGVWQGSRLRAGGDYALLGTTMAPGFTPSDYVGGERDTLIAQYPDARKQIRRLTRVNT
jgi:predicted cupin superfamily sugar epimerase